MPIIGDCYQRKFKGGKTHYLCGQDFRSEVDGKDKEMYELRKGKAKTKDIDVYALPYDKKGVLLPLEKRIPE
eukprot:260167-Amorphochlora_amoeboformis.AAC.1